MRALLAAALLLAPALAGCALSGTATPVVLVRESYALSGGAGRAPAAFTTPCATASYSLDPLRVDLARPDGHRPDFVVLYDHGDSWRGYAVENASGSAVAGLASASWGGPLDALLGDRVDTSGSSALSGWGPFQESGDAVPAVSWHDGAAWLGSERLAQGTPVQRSVAYDVATDAGAPIHVVETVEATYLGLVEVGLRPMPADCRGGNETVQAPG